MSEDEIRDLTPQQLKDLLIEKTFKVSNLKQAKKDYNKTVNEMLKETEAELNFALSVLEGKDSELARRIFIEVKTEIDEK